MSTTKRMAAVAIGVSSAEKLTYLPGAVNGARDFFKWAQAMGYEARLITDEENQVTLPRLRAELEDLLEPATAPIHRLLLYFAGHGLIREAEEGLWLLSDWKSEARAVNAERLRRRLYYYGIRQIGIFADACRDIANNMEQLDLDDDAVLGAGPGPNQMPEIDRFVATQDGTKAHMIPGADPEDDRCLFTGVLMEGLWGAKPNAFSKQLTDRVTSSSLGSYLRSEVPQVAQRYSLTLRPFVSNSFDQADDVYFGDGVPPPPPTFQPWPPPGSLLIAARPMGAGFLSGDAINLDGFVNAEAALEGESSPKRLVHGLPKVPPSSTKKKTPTKPKNAAGKPAKPKPAAAMAPPVVLGPPMKSLLDRIRGQQSPTHYETGAGLAVAGGEVKAIWGLPGTLAERDPNGPGWWRLGEHSGYRLQRPTPMLIELTTKQLVAVTALPEFILSVVVDERGAAAVVYRPVYGDPASARRAEEALSAMDSGSLRAHDALDLAVSLRREKHTDPVLGVISAYLYDSIGDLDNIRRIAAAYAWRNQAIPFDVALLAQMPGTLRDGVLHVEVPAVPARKPLTDEEKAASWAYSAEAPIKGFVGGLWPWMRQGWGYLDEATPGEQSLIHPGLIGLMPRLTRGRFATLDAKGGRLLAALFGLQRQ